MRIAIIGAGAIGGNIGAQLAHAGAEVSLLARGPHLAAIQAKGLSVEAPEQNFTVKVKASDDPAVLGPQDALIITVKSPALPDLAPKLKPLFGPETFYVTAMNGVPHWFFYNQPAPHKDRRLQSIDPDGLLWRALPPERAVGGMLWMPVSVPEPGKVRRSGENRLMLGEPDGRESARVSALAAILQQGGISVPVSKNIRREIWLKLVANIGSSPLSVLTDSDVGAVSTDPGTAVLKQAIQEETTAVGRAFGFEPEPPATARLTNPANRHKPSMLQDFEAGRPMEIESIIGVVPELGRLADIPTPTIDLILALMRRKAAALAERRSA